MILFYFHQHDLWFWLGSAAFRTEKWELGVRAYSRCTNIEPDVCKSLDLS